MMREKLAAVFSLVQEVNVLDSKDEANLALLARPELGITFTKLHCWRLTQYEKCVFVDADTLVVRNCDELFEREELSAAPDVGWPDCFNSGVFVFRPSQQTFASITSFATAKGSFDGGDQGLLNMYFNDWARKDISKHLPFIYNMCSTAAYSYLPAFKQFGDDVRIIHFIGITKPWLQYFDTMTGIVQPPSGLNHLQPLLQLWWNIFCDKVHSQLSPVMATSTLAPIWHDIFPLPVVSFLPNDPVYNETNYESYSDVCPKTPDFSEFKDPWENYSLKNDMSMDKNKGSIENVHYFYDNNEITGTSSGNHNYRNPPYQDTNQFYPVNYNELSAHLHKVEYHKKEENVPFIEHKKQQEEFAYSYSKDNYVENHPKVSQQFHWQSDQHQHQYQGTSNVDVNVHQHIHDRHEKEHHFECQYETNENDQKFTSDNNCYVNFHIVRETSDSSNNNNHDHHQHAYHINQYQESNISHHHHHHHHHRQQQQQQQQQQHYCQEEKDHNQKEQKERHYQHNIKQTIDFIQPSHDSTHNSEHKTSETIYNEQNNYPSNIMNKQTDEQKLTSHPSSEPCTDLHNVATQSDLNLTGHLDSSNAGLAGALAQMTLGEPRSAEQIALEEHMRKQSWEQGQIDYMGRDSFDNIWKKICETLSLAPRQPSPAKTTEDEIKNEGTEELNATKETSIDLMPKSEGTDDINSLAAETTSDLSVKQSLICKIPKDDISQEKSIDTSQILTKDESVDINIQQSSTVHEEVDSKKVSVDADSKEQLPQLETENNSETVAELPVIKTIKEICAETITELPSSSSDQTTIVKETVLIDPIKDITVTEEFDRKAVQDEKVDIQACVDKVDELSIEQDTKCSSACASEIILTNPVPIQVAESVLQTEPKESVSQDLKLITEEVISSTIAPLQESVVAFSETPVELTDRTQLCDPTLLVSSNEAANIIDPNRISNTSQNGDTVVNGSTIKLDESESLLARSVIKQVVQEIESPKEEESQPQKTETLSEQSNIMESSRIKREEEKEETIETVETKKETEDLIAATESKVEQSEDVEGAATAVETSESTPMECPIRPTRTKEISIPSTPTVTEPTPPTSPIDASTQDVEGQGKTVKKITKKVTKKPTSESDSTDRTDTEASEKKTAKKVVKKVVKKPKESQEEGGESSSSTDKPKKTAKSTKKITKPLQSLETDASIPETPPPDSSDAPVPPKRKVKASTSNKPASTAPKSDTGS
ncbi:probable serine/threonine-protein kinase kinX isoform X2 [Vespa velutina]|nr:probable serine/threonine-protein kinase kinX isoform X2 [Vespa velutina]